MLLLNVQNLNPLGRLILITRLLVCLGAAAFAVSVPGETLEEAFDIALQQDARLAASRHQVLAAEFGLAAAQGLAKPQVSLEALYNRLSDDPAFRIKIAPLPSTVLPFAQAESTLLHAGVTLPLYTGGRLTHAANAADAQLLAAHTDVERTRQDIKFSVAEAYVGVLRARHLLELAESGVITLTAHLRDVNAFLEHGLVARSDALAASAAEAAARQDQMRAATALELAQASYNRLLGRPMDSPVRIDDLAQSQTANAVSEPGPSGSGPRPELVGLTHQADALTLQSKASRAAGLPQVVLTAGYSQLQNRYLDKEQLWNLGIGMRWELFDGDVHRRQADALAARADAVSALRTDLESQIALQVLAANLLRDESDSRIPVAATAVAQAQENLRVARDRYQSGVGSHTEVLDAETLRIKSGSNYYSALYDHVLALQRVKRASGSL